MKVVKATRDSIVERWFLTGKRSIDIDVNSKEQFVDLENTRYSESTIYNNAACIKMLGYDFELITFYYNTKYEYEI